MSCRLLILALVVTGLTACTAGTPTAPVPAAPQTRTEMPVAQLVATATAPATVPTLPPPAVGDMRLTILYDNTAIDSRLKSGSGFAALVEYGGHTLLFDAGPIGADLLNNMRELGVDPRSIEAVILSHPHQEHIVGVNALLGMGIRPTVYVLPAFSSVFKSRVSDQTKLVEVTAPLEIVPGVHTTGPVKSFEQALVVETRDGTTVITGCAHPGVAETVRQAQEVVPGKVALLAGGFFSKIGKNELPPIIAAVRQLGVPRVLPTYCTSADAVAQFHTEYGENYIAGGAGRTVTSSGKELNRVESSLH